MNLHLDVDENAKALLVGLMLGLITASTVFGLIQVLVFHLGWHWLSLI
jgi:hypothetical protein